MKVTRKERLIRILGLMQRTGARFTLDELAEMTGMTPLSIKAMLTRLRDEGFRVRSIRVYEVIEVPDHPLIDSEVEVPVQVDHDSLMPIGVESGF